MVSSELEIRPYQSGDECHILELFQQSYGRELGESLWAWRFRHNPAGPGLIYLSWDHDVLAAHYAVTTVASQIGGRDWLTGLSGTTMTHPRYRGRGLFTQLAQRTYEHMARSGMAMVWGFPNTLSHRGFVRDLDWVDVYEVPTFRLSLAECPALPALGDHVVECAQFDERFDHLWEQAQADYQFITKRDQKHLQWRYVQNPVERYRILAYRDAEQILGYVVFKRYQSELQVVDILTVPGAAVGVQLISYLAHTAQKDAVPALSLWLNVTHPLHHALEKMGFRNGEPVTYLGGLVLQPELLQTPVYDFRTWYLSMGDSDVF